MSDGRNNGKSTGQQGPVRKKVSTKLKAALVGSGIVISAFAFRSCCVLTEGPQDCPPCQETVVITPAELEPTPQVPEPEPAAPEPVTTGRTTSGRTTGTSDSGGTTRRTTTGRTTSGGTTSRRTTSTGRSKGKTTGRTTTGRTKEKTTTTRTTGRSGGGKCPGGLLENGNGPAIESMVQGAFDGGAGTFYKKAGGGMLVGVVDLNLDSKGYVTSIGKVYICKGTECRDKVELFKRNQVESIIGKIPVVGKKFPKTDKPCTVTIMYPIPRP